MRQDGFMRGREEFLASAITSAISGAGSLSSVGGSNGGGGAGMRERRNVGPSITSRVQVGVCDGWMTSVLKACPYCILDHL